MERRSKSAFGRESLVLYMLCPKPKTLKKHGEFYLRLSPEPGAILIDCYVDDGDEEGPRVATAQFVFEVKNVCGGGVEEIGDSKHECSSQERRVTSVGG